MSGTQGCESRSSNKDDLRRPSSGDAVALRAVRQRIRDNVAREVSARLIALIESRNVRG